MHNSQAEMIFALMVKKFLVLHINLSNFKHYIMVQCS